METAIVVPLPEVAPAIDEIRRKHTRAGAEGMPAHVTLLIPFADSESLLREDLDRLATIVKRFHRFDVTLGALRYFEGANAVLYLAPEPSNPFVRMVAALVDAFPACPPYGSAHPDPIPHITVAVGERTSLEPFEREVASRLPIVASVTAAWL
ncbi:MAG: 2'-5' RNA ligase family protein, partial [Actinobacteria bacterium]|nr:2'-5' RNA ligase family protein [Actinomycetota bacterium]